MNAKSLSITPEQLAALIQVNIAIDEIIETGKVNSDVIEELKEINPIISYILFSSEKEKPLYQRRPKQNTRA